MDLANAGLEWSVQNFHHQIRPSITRISGEMENQDVGYVPMIALRDKKVMGRIIGT
jgi:hypothetical protein